MAIDPLNFITNKTPIGQIATGVSSGITSVLNGLFGGFASAGASTSTMTSQGASQVDNLTAGGDQQFFSGSAARASLDAISSLRNLPDTETYLSSIAPQSAVENSKSDTAGSKVLRYPLDLPDKYFFQLAFSKYSRPSPLSPTKFDVASTIILPIPNELVEGQSINYTTKELGAEGILAEQIAQTIKDKGNIKQTYKRFYGDKTNGGQKATADIYAFGAATLNSLDDGAAGTLGQFTGVVPNPHPSVFFQGISLREHSFNWTFVPSNQAEGAQLATIINEIRKKTLPTADSSQVANLLDYPFMIQPQIITNGKPLYKFKLCVCNRFTVNYSPLGSPAFYKDASPFAIQLSMSLQEIEYFTAEAYGATSGTNFAQSEKGLVNALSDLRTFVSGGVNT